MATILHRIKAYLYENFLTDDPNDYFAKVSSERSLDVKAICESAVSRGGADTTAAAMEHNVNLFFKEMGFLLCDGFSVNTGYFNAGIDINGVFNSPTETFNRNKHSLYFQFNQGGILRKESASVEVDILGLAESGTLIALVTDVKTGSVNDLITPNRNLKIKGAKLKLAGDNAAVGVYFVNRETNESTKVDASDVVTNSPSELIIVVPVLTAGTYTLEVRTQFSGGDLLKEPRLASFDRLLTVQ